MLAFPRPVAQFGGVSLFSSAVRSGTLVVLSTLISLAVSIFRGGQLFKKRGVARKKRSDSGLTQHHAHHPLRNQHRKSPWLASDRSRPPLGRVPVRTHICKVQAMAVLVVLGDRSRSGEVGATQVHGCRAGWSLVRSLALLFVFLLVLVTLPLCPCHPAAAVRPSPPRGGVACRRQGDNGMGRAEGGAGCAVGLRGISKRTTGRRGLCDITPLTHTHLARRACARSRARWPSPISLSLPQPLGAPAIRSFFPTPTPGTLEHPRARLSTALSIPPHPSRTGRTGLFFLYFLVPLGWPRPLPDSSSWRNQES